jgi:uncharacterized membrane protein
MSESDFQMTPSNRSESRVVMHILYGLHTVAWLSAGALAVIALIVNYIRRGEETDPLLLGHHNYMISTFWWTLLWLVLCSPLWLLFGLPGAAAYTVIGFWYLYRCIKGWLRIADGKPA